MLYVSKVKRKKKSTLLKENNNKMLYVSEVIKTKGLEKKKDSFTYRLKSSNWVKFSWMDWNGWNWVEWARI